MLVWTVVGGLAALTVILRAPSEGLNLSVASSGPQVMLPALAAAVVAGLRSLPRAFAAGVALGILDQLVRWNVDKQSVSSVVLLAVTLVALLVRRADARARRSRGGRGHLGDRRDGARAARRRPLAPGDPHRAGLAADAGRRSRSWASRSSARRAS